MRLLPRLRSFFRRHRINDDATTPDGNREKDCLGRKFGNCTDWEHCDYCDEVEQAIRAIPKDQNTL